MLVSILTADAGWRKAVNAAQGIFGTRQPDDPIAVFTIFHADAGFGIACRSCYRSNLETDQTKALRMAPPAHE